MVFQLVKGSDFVGKALVVFRGGCLWVMKSCVTSVPASD